MKKWKPHEYCIAITMILLSAVMLHLSGWQVHYAQVGTYETDSQITLDAYQHFGRLWEWP
jgi:hypothetical protein